jgi:hypothetical protein
MSGATNAVGEGIGAAGMGYGLSMNPQLNLTNPMTELQPDQAAIYRQMGTQQGITNQNLGDINSLYSQMGPQLINNMVQQLGPNGTAGQQLEGEFNNSGLLNSGAFNQGLANQFLPLQQQLLQGQLGANQGIINQGAQTQSGLGQTGLQNELGLQSQGVNTQNSQALAQFMQQAGLQSSLIGGGMNTVGQSAGKGGVI